MEIDPSKVQRRIKIVLPFFLIIGLLIYFLLDKMTGIIITVGGLIGVGVGVIYINKAKKNTTNVKRNLALLLIVCGSLMLICGLVVIILERGSAKDVIYSILAGIFFLIYGIMILKNKDDLDVKWRNMPFGMKAIVIFLLIRILLSLRSLVIDVGKQNSFLWLIVQQPFSILLNIVYFLIPIFIVLAIYKKSGWKLILFLQGFMVVNWLSGGIMILITPLAELYTKLNLKVPNVSPEILESFAFKVKLIISIPMLLGLIIAGIIWFYIYKNKDYFSNDKLKDSF